MFSIQKRLQKELQALLKDPPAGVHLDGKNISGNLAE
jgi:ubiquitin-protein ligase